MLYNPALSCSRLLLSLSRKRTSGNNLSNFLLQQLFLFLSSLSFFSTYFFVLYCTVVPHIFALLVSVSSRKKKV